MHAIQITQHGGPEVMKWTELPTPSPAAGEVLVRTEVAGVNFIDVYFRTGAYAAKLPVILGVDGAGVVQAVGGDVSAFRAGDRVAWADRAGAAGPGGSYATHVVVPAARLVAVPPEVDARTAAAAMLQGMT